MMLVILLCLGALTSCFDGLGDALDGGTSNGGSNNGGGGDNGSGGGEAVYYTLTFETNGGSAIDPMKAAAGSAIVAPAAPTKDDCNFAGWYTDAACTLPFTFAKMPYSDMTLYAKWSEDPVILFETDGGSAVAAITAPAGTPIMAPADPTKEGYNFLGWVTADNVPFVFDSMPAESITLYATWEKIPEKNEETGGDDSSELPPLVDADTTVKQNVCISQCFVLISENADGSVISFSIANILNPTWARAEMGTVSFVFEKGAPTKAVFKDRYIYQETVALTKEGNSYSAASTKSQENQSVCLTLNAKGEIASLTWDSMIGSNLTFSFDASGRVSSCTVSSYIEMLYNYKSSAVELTMRSEGKDLSTVTISYDKNGRPTRIYGVSNGESGEYIWTYDKSGLCKSVVMKVNGKTFTDGVFEYDAKGRLTHLSAETFTESGKSDGSIAYWYRYNDAGLVVYEEQESRGADGALENRYETTYEYSADGDLLRELREHYDGDGNYMGASDSNYGESELKPGDGSTSEQQPDMSDPGHTPPETSDPEHTHPDGSSNKDDDNDYKEDHTDNAGGKAPEISGDQTQDDAGMNDKDPGHSGDTSLGDEGKMPEKNHAFE